MTVLFVIIVVAWVLAFLTATFGYLRAKIAALEPEMRAEEERELEAGGRN